MDLKDAFGRRFAYLRLSVTELCNFRCGYCLPNGYHKTFGPGFLSGDEIERLVRALVELGVWKVRLTGGEPSLRSDLPELIARLVNLSGLRAVALTTNGYALEKMAPVWASAGLSALNVSVDSLVPETFHRITGHDRLHEVRRGLEVARAAGLATIKVNAVLLKDINDGELPAFLDWIRRDDLSVRFIELMQTGDNAAYFAKHHLRADVVRAHLERRGWRVRPRVAGAGPAEVFEHEDYRGTVGLIAPYAKDFCASCNRLRVTARGDVRLCLFGDQSYSLRDLLQHDDQKHELQTRLHTLFLGKPAGHFLQTGETGLTKNLAGLGG